ncbi:DUF697 domain-containing protein [Ectothiorhodospiraceae bacterium BW-2]|nr:DUF697 domain-containing protein [Ectothiorhodospiraceae bacterium BW-2]
MNQTTTTIETVPPPSTTIESDRATRARQLIQNYAYGAAGVGLVPNPFFGQVTVGAMAAKLIYDLGQLYDIPTPKYRTKAAIAAVLGGAHTQWISFYALGATTLIFPAAGFLGTLLYRPLISGAIIYTLGNIFSKQFSRGVRIEQLNTEALKAEFDRGFAEGKTWMAAQQP